jgi:hypothetical protein
MPAGLARLVNGMYRTDKPREGETMNLRKANELRGSRIQATDGPLGRLNDFLFDGEEWVVSYLVVDTHRWLPGRRVLIVPSWIDRLSWDEKTIHISVDKDLIEGSTEYDPSSAIGREYEEAVLAYYKEMVGQSRQAGKGGG